MKKIICLILSVIMLIGIVSPVTADNGDIRYKALMYNDRKSEIKSYEAEFIWNDGWFDGSSEEYNHTLATSLCVLCGAAYVDTKPENITKTLINMGYGENFFSSYITPTREENDSVGYVIANKEYDRYDLVTVIIKGTSEDSEWYSNFNIGDGEIHEGFNIAALKLYSDLEKYISTLGDNDKKFLITGHSRGAGVANIVAKMLNESSYADKKDIFAYTFASPLVSLDACTEGYENIFNILCSADFVTRLPIASWSYGRFGNDMFLPEKSFGDIGLYNEMIKTVSQKYSESTGKSFTAFEGTFSTDNLVREIYKRTDDREDFYIRQMYRSEKNTATFNDYFTLMSDILSGNVGISQSVNLLKDYALEFAVVNDYFMENHITNDRLFSTHSTGAYFYKLSCCKGSDLSEGGYFYRLRSSSGVNLKVADEDGEVLAEVADRSIINNILAVNMTAAEIIVDIPAEGKYTVQITSSSPVSADISVEKLKVSHTEIPEAVMDFYGIEVSDKDDVTLCFGEDITLDQNGENIPADNSCEGNVPIYTVMTESVGNGMCYGSGKFRKGEKVTVYADSSFMENFLGWFDGEALVSKSASYSFAVEDYTHLYAKFSEKVSLMGDINKDRKVNSDDLSMLLEKYAATDSSCDLDRNGVVNSADLSMLLGNFGKAL